MTQLHPVAALPPSPGSVWVNDDGLSFTVKAVTAEPHEHCLITVVPSIGAAAGREAVEFDLTAWSDFIVTNGLRELPADTVPQHSASD